MGVSSHSCLTLFINAEFYFGLLLLLASSWLSLHIQISSLSLNTVSKAFVKNTAYSSMFYMSILDIGCRRQSAMSIVLLFSSKQHCISSKMFEVFLSLNLFRIMRVNIFLAIYRRVVCNYCCFSCCPSQRLMQCLLISSFVASAHPFRYQQSSYIVFSA